MTVLVVLWIVGLWWRVAAIQRDLWTAGGSTPPPPGTALASPGQRSARLSRPDAVAPVRLVRHRTPNAAPDPPLGLAMSFQRESLVTRPDPISST